MSHEQNRNPSVGEGMAMNDPDVGKILLEIISLENRLSPKAGKGEKDGELDSYAGFFF